jgi:hypothetical protein
MERRLAPESEKAAQWLADLHEDLPLIRYPTRVEMLRAVGEAVRRAESLARLEYALQRLRPPGAHANPVAPLTANGFRGCGWG